jgi:outer membrane lipoprotein-sorting protein
MVPAIENKEYKEVEAAIDQSSQTLVQVTLTLRNGTKQQIDISDYNANHNFTDVEFLFDNSRYPNVEIIDLR